MKTSKALKDYHRRLVAHLEASASAETAEWFTNYLKGAIQYRGLKTPQLKGILKAFFAETGAEELPPEIQLKHIRYWLAQPMAEDKLIAILWLKDWLKFQARGPDAIETVSLVLALLEDVFAAGDIHDWSTNDWLCVRVLETIVEKYPQLNGRLMGWLDAEPLWQRRSALLAFKKGGKQGLFHDEIAALIEGLLPSDERFIQTAVGWVLCDASRNYPDWASSLFEKYFDELTHEVIVRHTKYLENHANLKRRSRERR